MTDDDPDISQLKHQQLEQERAEREGLDSAINPADADRHRRRADKARYLREKLEQREQADRAAARDDER